MFSQRTIKRIFGLAAIPVLVVLAAGSGIAAQMQDYCVVPPFIQKHTPPLVMVVLGKDHKLFFEAYNDAVDLDGDGQLDITYDNRIDYYGYFDTERCYRHNTGNTNGEFDFVGMADAEGLCNGAWPGKVLNYITMSRMDVLRKVLYGGTRIADNQGSGAFLQRAFIPADGHSWGKEITGRLCNESGVLTTQCETSYDCTDADGNQNGICVDVSGRMSPLGATTPPTVCSGNPVQEDLWDDHPGKMLFSRHQHGNTNCGVSNNDILSSYEPSVANLIDYGYVDGFSAEPPFNPNVDHLDKYNVHVVTEFYVNAADAGIWDFVIDGDDGVELQVDGTVITGWYGCHSACYDEAGADPLKLRPVTDPAIHPYEATNSCNQVQQNGWLTLQEGWHRLVVRHSENNGQDGARVWYRPYNLVTGFNEHYWYMFGAGPETDPGTGRVRSLQLRAPDVPAGDECTITTMSFVQSGDPYADKGFVGGGRHLFCNTTLQDTPSSPDNYTPLMRIVANSPRRIWEWASVPMSATTAPCDNAAAFPNPTDLRVRVKSCFVEGKDCIFYRKDGVYKPEGLFQKYGHHKETVCSKSFKPCGNDGDCQVGEFCATDAKMFFGLMTGSYTNNLNGGVVRKDIGPITDEINNQNGQIKCDASVPGCMAQTLDTMVITGFHYNSKQYVNCNDGWITDRSIINGECMDWGNPVGEMLYEAGRYFAGRGIPQTNFKYGSKTAPDGVYKNAKFSFNGLGLSQMYEWLRNPYDRFVGCAKPFTLLLSDVFPSYDSDALPGANPSWEQGVLDDKLPDLNVTAELNTITATEGIVGSYLIGESGASTDKQCGPKAVGSMAQTRGLCIEEPEKQGSFTSAAVAHYNKTEMKVCRDDLKTYCANDGDCPGGGPCDYPRDITNYSVAMTSPVPKLDIAVSGRTITLLPFGKSVSGGGGDAVKDVKTHCFDQCTVTWDPLAGGGAGRLNITNCGPNAYCHNNQIVDFYMDKYTNKSGRFRVTFDSVEQAGDFDMDALIEYSYCVGTGCNPVIGGSQIKVTLNSVNASEIIEQALGFVITGTTEDGTWLVVRDRDNPGQDLQTKGVPTTWTKTFNLSFAGGTAKKFEDPLWYAAKWGGFKDQNKNGVPDQQAEWDVDSDGIPDTYFLVSNPMELERQLEKAFTDILKRVSSGTAVSVLASGEGQGANMLQAVFYPLKDYGWDPLDTKELSWTGVLNNLWYHIDPKLGSSTIREDTLDDAELHLDQDWIANLTFDDKDGQTVALTCPDANADGGCDAPPTSKKFEDLNSLWEAGIEMFTRNVNTNPRRIFTNNGGVIGVLHSGFSAELGATDAAEAQRIIDYLQGFDDGSYFDPPDYAGKGRHIGVCSTTRSKICGDIVDCPVGETCVPARRRVAELDVGGGKVENTWKMGDIVHSTPRIQSWIAINDYFDKYHDASYDEYVNSPRYEDRGMVHVGGNDGMHHALSLGLLSVINDRGNPYHKASLGPPAGGGTAGEESWSYVPGGALPYLKYLLDPDYCHLYYIDAPPYVFDASIANGAAAAKDVSSWRTVVIGSMGLGGACRNQGTGCGKGAATETCVETPLANKGYSSYYALDVTDETNPQVLWEFPDPNRGDHAPYLGQVGMSLTGPVIIKVSEKDGGGNPDNTKEGHWFAVIPSGPTGPINDLREFIGTSDQELRLFVLDLRTGKVVRVFDNLTALDPDLDEAFGGITLNTNVDVDLDYQDDIAYFGYVTKQPLKNGDVWKGGGILRLLTNEDENPANWDLSLFMKMDSPMMSSPTFLRNKKAGGVTAGVAGGSFWLYFGTGRYFYKDDLPSGQMRIWGVKEPCYDARTNDINKATAECAAGVLTGNIHAADSTVLSPAAMDAKAGWVIDLDCSDDGAGGFPCGSGVAVDPAFNSERNITDPTPVPAGAVFFTTFAPTNDPCKYGGDTFLWGLDWRTGGGAMDEALVGKALLQLSTGEIKEVDLSSIFTERIVDTYIDETNKEARARKSVAFSGVPPAGQGLAVMVPPEPVQRVLILQEK